MNKKFKKEGMSQESMRLRRRLLTHNASMISKLIKASRLANPMGWIVDTTDEIGKGFCYPVLESQGLSKHEISELLATHIKNGATPTILGVSSLELARKLLPIISDNALQILSKPMPKGMGMVVVIAGGGNTYGIVPLD
jgi:hypothetical protein